VTLKVATTKNVIWENYVEPETTVEGVKTTFSIDIVNDGNAPLSHRIGATGPDGWEITMGNGDMVELSAGEARTLTVEVLANEPGIETVIISLLSADDVSGSSHSIEFNVTDDPHREVSSSGSTIQIIGAVILLLLICAGGFVLVSMRKKETFTNINLGKNTGNLPGPSPNSAAAVLPPPPNGNSQLPPPVVNGELPPPPNSSSMETPAPPVQDIDTTDTTKSSEVGDFPLPPPPQSQPVQAPPADAFVQVDGEPQIAPQIEEDTIEESSGSDSEEDAVASASAAAEVITSTKDEPKPEENEESDPNHKCWVCLGILPTSGWQACPKCGARYHLGDSECGISKLSNCRNCEGNVSEFVKV
jgi:hypothetical protein